MKLMSPATHAKNRFERAILGLRKLKVKLTAKPKKIVCSMTRKFIFIFTYLFLLQLYAANLTSNAEIKMACKAASAHMPNGNGFAIYYPNGRLLTPSAG